MIETKNKNDIIAEFETMKSLELSGYDLYTQIANDRRISTQKIRDTFRKMAKDEQNHAEIVQKIIDLL